jgi:O-antigen/teichoic acid export membrane protein
MSKVLPRLLLGNILAQAMTFGCIPIITRLYSPAAISDWSIALVVTNMVLSFSQLRTDIALYQAKTPEERSGLFQLGLVSHLTISVLVIPILVVLHWIHLRSSFDVFLLYFIISSQGILQLTMSWLAASHAFSEQNKTRLLAAVLTYPGAVILCYLGGDYWLMPALLLGSLVPLLVLFNRVSLPIFPLKWAPNEWKSLLKSHKSTGFYLTAGNLLASLSEQAMVLVIARYYSAYESAACFLALRVCSAPLSLVQAALTPYNLRHFNDLFNQQLFDIQIIIKHWFKWAIPAVLFFVPLFLFGPQIFSFVLGKDWNFAGQIASIIALWAAIKFLSNPTMMGFFVIGKVHLYFVTTLLMASTMIICLYLSIIGGSLLTMLRFFAIAQIIVLVGCNALMLFNIDQKFNAQRSTKRY